VQDVRSAKPVTVTADGEIIEPAPPPDLTKQLAASIDWGKWVADHLASMRNAQDRGAFNEVWADVRDEVQRMQPPADSIKALNEGKAEIKASRGWK